MSNYGFDMRKLGQKKWFGVILYAEKAKCGGDGET